MAEGVAALDRVMFCQRCEPFNECRPLSSDGCDNAPDTDVLSDIAAAIVHNQKTGVVRLCIVEVEDFYWRLSK